MQLSRFFVIFLVMYCSHCGQQLLKSGSNFCVNCGSSVKSLEATANEISKKQRLILASQSKRLINLILDSVFAFGLFLLIALVITPLWVFYIGDTLEGTVWIWIVGTLIYFYFGVYGLFFESIWQRTPAKWITKTKAVMRDGTKPDFVHILGRNLARFIPFEALTFLTNQFPIGWHDRFSGTLVVHINCNEEDVRSLNIEALQKSSKSSMGLLVVVIVAIAILTFIMWAFLNGNEKREEENRDAWRYADIRQLQVALELYKNSNGIYPFSLSYLKPFQLNEIPKNPQPFGADCPSSIFYDYRQTRNGKSYVLTYCLEKGGQQIAIPDI